MRCENIGQIRVRYLFVLSQILLQTDDTDERNGDGKGDPKDETPDATPCRAVRRAYQTLGDRFAPIHTLGDTESESNASPYERGISTDDFVSVEQFVAKSIRPDVGRDSSRHRCDVVIVVRKGFLVVYIWTIRFRKFERA
jgi:hypothetical protein